MLISIISTVNTSTFTIQTPATAAASQVPPPRAKLKRLGTCAGLLLAESMIAAAILAILIVGTSQALLTANRLASASRILTGARAVLQRNIDTALASTFTQTSTPAILQITPAGGSLYDDDGGFDNAIQIAVQDNGTAVVASGTLTRTVLAITNADNAEIRNITFRLQYTYRGRPQDLSMSTIRSRDD